MTNKKQRMSMLDSLAAAGTPAPSDMMPGNRALRAARDAVDAHKVWDLDPDQIDSSARIRDRLEGDDVTDLRDAIEQNGQTVPILVRRDPAHPDRYLLVYGARRLEAIRQSEKITRVRALVASMGDEDATRAQISENMARRDLSFIEKSLFAKELIDSGFGNQAQVAEVLTVTKSSVSMALTILEMVGADLVRAIGPAHGIGRPRWEALGKALAETTADRAPLIDLADRTRSMGDYAALLDPGAPADFDPSVAAFEAVMQALPKPRPPAPPPAAAKPLRIRLGEDSAALRRTGSGLRFDIPRGDFSDWLESQAEDILQELHERWKQQS